MTIEQNPNLDEQTRLTLRVIELERKTSFLENKIKEVLETTWGDFDKIILPLASRISVLEEVRLKQRELKVAEPIEGNKEVKAEPKKPRFKFW